MLTAVKENKKIQASARENYSKKCQTGLHHPQNRTNFALDNLGNIFAWKMGHARGRK